jgi:N-methylhydantoinase B
MAAGRWRGGIGAIREFTFLDDAGFSLEGEGHALAPWGFDGGADGLTASLTLKRPDGTEQILPSKVLYFKVKAGDKLVSFGPCGGGYGDASLRPSEAIATDVADGLIASDVARGLFAQAEK